MLHRVVLTVHGRELAFSGYLSVQRPNSARVAAFSEMGGTLFDVLLPPNGGAEVVRSAPGLKPAWLADGVGGLVRLLYLAADQGEERAWQIEVQASRRLDGWPREIPVSHSSQEHRQRLYGHGHGAAHRRGRGQRAAARRDTGPLRWAAAGTDERRRCVDRWRGSHRCHAGGRYAPTRVVTYGGAPCRVVLRPTARCSRRHLASSSRATAEPLARVVPGCEAGAPDALRGRQSVPPQSARRPARLVPSAAGSGRAGAERDRRRRGARGRDPAAAARTRHPRLRCGYRRPRGSSHLHRSDKPARTARQRRPSRGGTRRPGPL